MIYNGKSIRNIIFDLGGVLLNIDYNLCVEAFRKLGLNDFESLYSKAKQSTLFDDFEKGSLSAADFRDTMRKFLKPGITDEQIDRAWNAMLLDFPEERGDLLLRLKNDHRLFLLSNTNEIHIKEVSAILKRSFGVPDLSRVFEKEYFSHRVKLRKPHREIFKFVLNENNLEADETLFIDDSRQHIEGAMQTGLHVFHLVKGKNILEVFT